MTQNLGGSLQAMKELNVIAAFAMGLFFMVSLAMVGLAQIALEWVLSVRLLPLTVSLGLMVIAFLSSGSRDPSQYHWIEKTYVFFTVGLMTLFAWQPWVDLVMSFEPFGSIVSLILMCIGTAILAK